MLQGERNLSFPYFSKWKPALGSILQHWWEVQYKFYIVALFLIPWTTRALESQFSEKLVGTVFIHWWALPMVAMEMPVVQMPGPTLRWAIPQVAPTPSSCAAFAAPGPYWGKRRSILDTFWWVESLLHRKKSDYAVDSPPSRSWRPVHGGVPPLCILLSPASPHPRPSVCILKNLTPDRVAHNTQISFSLVSVGLWRTWWVWDTGALFSWTGGGEWCSIFLKIKGGWFYQTHHWQQIPSMMLS